jgi:hypothetical protein
MPPRAAVLGGGGAVTERNSDDFRNHCARLRQCMNYLDLEILSHTLRLSPAHVDKVYQYALQSLTPDGAVAKASLENELKLVKERLKLKEDIPVEKVADWRFVKELASVQ